MIADNIKTSMELSGILSMIIEGYENIISQGTPSMIALGLTFLLGFLIGYLKHWFAWR